MTIFKDGRWNPDKFDYVYSPRCRSYRKFVQESTCIRNARNPDTGDFDYVSMVAKKRYATGCVAETHCSFENYGAPLIVIAGEATPCPDGVMRYGHHIEVVAYEGGVNVWHLIPEGNTVRPVNVIRKKFPVEPNRLLSLSVSVMEKSLDISLDGTSFGVDFDRIPREFLVGITACEGINRFYDFDVR